MSRWPLLTLPLMLLLWPTTVTATTVQHCVDRGITGILAVREIDRFIDAQAMAQRIVGPAWRNLEPPARTAVAQTMGATLRERLAESARSTSVHRLSLQRYLITRGTLTTLE